MNKEIVVIRHGQSEWNKINQFTGWVDVELSEQGIEEAIQAGKILKTHNYHFTMAFTSVLKRANETLRIVLEQIGQNNLPVIRDWRLNERHYGDLQGKNKQQMRDEYGDEQVHIWRRSYNTKPPKSAEQPVPEGYDGLESYPQGESLEDTVFRVQPYWENVIKPKVKSGEKIIISAHGNSLRALIKLVEGISDDEIVKLEIPTGKPIKITFDENMNFISRDYIE
ncbi:MAG: 2,3-bisphosphoglycerate-dependent phosphoglycerate mutase [Halobacteriovoraceae bacterium]|nr:2,3-bisphosphoglycerate-dependent phosphoglycerate mutase [Halobacteriovoraceae bacterium]MCB9093764.1 2,3-bisphosphoglycerate-dependent phosphoglycerate mutase [Halobacteriovoraceae bacterium]